MSAPSEHIQGHPGQQAQVCLGVGVGRLEHGGNSSQIRFCPEHSPSFGSFCGLSSASVILTSELLLFLLCILLWIGLVWSGQFSLHTCLLNYPLYLGPL